MKVILFNGEDKPEPGATYRVIRVYDFYDGVYGPQTAVVLERVEFSKAEPPKLTPGAYKNLLRD